MGRMFKMESIQMELVNLLIAVVIACVGFVTKSVTGYLKKKGLLKQLENNKEVAKIVVGAVEQLYRELDGKGKLEISKRELVNVLNDRKINISEQEINLLVEAVVKEMNQKIKENK